MKELFSLGEIYPSDFLAPGEEPRSEKVEMKLMLDKDGFVRLEKAADLDKMYGRYWYRSGINNTMRTALKDIVDSITNIYSLKENDLWLDIASNDGQLLSNIPKGILKLGIDPVEDKFKKLAEEHADEIIQDFFTFESYNKSKFKNIKPKVITSIAMFYDVPDPDKFMQDIYKVLDQDGVWVMQLSYTLLMLKQLAADNICHEHLFYYFLYDIKKLAIRNGFKIMDCQLNDVNGGSFRVYLMKDVGDEQKFGSKPYRDVCEMRVSSLLKEEQLYLNLRQAHWDDFYFRFLELKTQTVDFIKRAVAKGKTVYAYGASTKGNTLLQCFGLDNTLITAIAERSPFKWGLRTVGTNIPIISEDEMRKANPDYLLVLPWHFVNEFKEREKDYLLNGGKMIIPCPSFQVI